MEKNSTIENIKNGNGLQPLNTSQPTTKPSGVTSEQRGQTPSGIRRDTFTLQENKKN